MTISPMNPRTARLNAAPRCGAKTRAGHPCRSPAVRGRPRCRMHGCAPGAGGQPGEKNGRYQHGKFTREAKEMSALMRELARTGEVFAARVMH
jgi:hypothetical protein